MNELSVAKTPSRERVIANPTAGLTTLIWGLILLFPTPITCFVIAGNSHDDFAIGFFVVLGLLSILSAALALRSLIIVNPNQAKVVVLFGRYLGTVRRDGFFAVHPFSIRKSVSLRAHNFTSDTLKVNDKLGNPIEIGAVVVWRVDNTAMATFDVEDYPSYIKVQSESAVRHLAAQHPYDITDHETAVSLRGSLDEVNHELQKELAERLSLAGIEVLEVRITHLAYAPEIAGAMLRRQQAEAIIAARQKIVEGAVSMVEMALAQLTEKNVVDLDPERRAAMVSNLLVVLCSDHDATPVINAGTLHG